MKRAEYQKAWVGQSDISTWQEVRLAWWLLALEESLAFQQGIVLDCVDLRRSDYGWKLRVQGRRHRVPGDRMQVVAWEEATTFVGCLESFAASIKHGSVKWRKDKFPVFDERPK